MNLPSLPIDAQLARVREALESHNCLIIQAPPGTGKTTRVAPGLLPSAGAAGQILLIQPRRIAARAAAMRIAEEQGWQVGQRIGYQVRFDAKLSRATQLVCMTPGILLRRLHSDIDLQLVSTVILDEFHERSLEVDLLLGMLRRIQIELRPELRIVVMSATLDADSLKTVMGNPPVISVSSIAYPVSIRYSRFDSAAHAHGRSVSQSKRIVEQATAKVIEAARQDEGDILVFLPGVGEIMQVARNLQLEADRHQWELLTLYGEMSAQDQDRVLARSPRRKLILSTNVAETSLTIDGVRIVVDSGWARVQRIDSGLGLDRLVLEPISQASAQQRAGRAGRTAAGICYRLWDEITDRSRAPFLEPEVLRVDLANAILHLLAWGERDVPAFPWVTAPRSSAVLQAKQLLEMLDAISQEQLTPLGASMLRLPVHPRIARFLLESQRLGNIQPGALAAALLSERDILDRQSKPNADFRRGTSQQSARLDSSCDVTDRVHALEQFIRTGGIATPFGTLKISAAKHTARVAEQFSSLMHADHEDHVERPGEGQAIQRALLSAYPDRLARRRAAGSPRALMVGGRGVKLDASSSVQRAELFICLDVDAASSEALVRLASAVQPEWLSTEHLREVDERFYNPTTSAVITRRRVYWLDLLLSETPIATPADEQTARLLSVEAAKQLTRLLPAKDRELQNWLARVQWLAQELPSSGLPCLEPEAMAEQLQGWCFGMRTLDEVKALPWKALLQGLLTPATRRLLEKEAPESVALPGGRRVWLQYEAGKPPVLAARIQDFFGMHETPRLAGGRVPLLLHLLAPNNRIQQITDDLASFWQNTYPSVRRELRGRYPKHAWPENPRDGHAKTS